MLVSEKAPLTVGLRLFLLGREANSCRVHPVKQNSIAPEAKGHHLLFKLFS